jgi:hypothetical protein
MRGASSTKGNDREAHSASAMSTGWHRATGEMATAASAFGAGADAGGAASAGELLGIDLTDRREGEVGEEPPQAR